jgi:hypothetical protein
MTNHCNSSVVQYNNKKIGYNLYLVPISLVSLQLISYGSQKPDIGRRIFGSKRIMDAPKQPQPML